MDVRIIRDANGARYVIPTQPNNTPTQPNSPTGGWFPIPPIFKTEEKVDTKEPGSKGTEASQQKTNWVIFAVAAVFVMMAILILKKK